MTIPSGQPTKSWQWSTHDGFSISVLDYEQCKESESQFWPVNSPKKTFKQDKSLSEIATVVASTAISSDLIAARTVARAPDGSFPTRAIPGCWRQNGGYSTGLPSTWNYRSQVWYIYIFILYNICLYNCLQYPHTYIHWCLLIKLNYIIYRFITYVYVCLIIIIVLY